MEDAQRLEKVLEIIEELRNLVKKGAIIVVEGVKDRRAMEALGIYGSIETLVGQESLLNFSERLAQRNRPVILMTDWDRTGAKIASDLATYIQPTGCDVDHELRSKLSKLVKKDIKDVESLVVYIERMKQKTGHS